MRNYSRYNRALIRKYEQWMIAMHYAKHTQSMYRKVLDRYVAFMGRRSVATAGHEDIQRYLSHISEDGATLNGAYRALGVLRLFFDFLNLGGVANYVAPRYVRLRRPWAEGPSPLTEVQVKRLISATRTLRERALIEFFYATGCRASEGLRLKIEDLDLDTRIARVCGKLGKVRTVMFTKSAAEVIRAYIAGRTKGYVFQQDRPAKKGCLYRYYGQWKLRFGVYRWPNGPTRSKTKCLGSVERVSYEQARRKQEEIIARYKFRPRTRKTPLTQVCLRGIFKKIASRSGLKKVTPHTLRRTFATHLYDHGAGIDVIKVLMGHVWIHTTMKYARMGQEKLTEIFDRCHPRDNSNEQPAL